MADFTEGLYEPYAETDELLRSDSPSGYGSLPRIYRRNKLRRMDDDDDTDSHTTYTEDRQRKTILICGRHVPSIVINILLSIASLILNIVSIVAVPIYANAIMEAGGSLFFMNTFYGLCVTSVMVLGSLAWSVSTGWPGTMIHRASWKVMFCLSQLSCATMLVMNYANDPQRTPAYLQAILSVTLIPFTILMRFLFFKKKPSTETLICTLAIVVGILIASEPRIFGFSDSSAVIENPNTTLAYRILWPAAFAVAHAPFAFVNCLQEKETKKEQVSSLGFMMWIHIINIFSFWSMFWTDLIPHFGTSSSVDDFGHRYMNGLKCVFGLHPNCMTMLLATWVTIVVAFLRYIVTFLLIRYTEGAVYSSMITSLGNPVGTMFWSLFKLYPNLHWEPNYTKATTYTLIGLAFMTPSVIIYNYLSYKEENRQNDNLENEYNDDDNVDDYQNDQGIWYRDAPSFSGSIDTDGGL